MERSARASTALRLEAAAVLVALVSGCALLKSTPEDVPPPALTARELWTMPPEQQKRLLAAPLLFAAHTWLDRLVCADVEQPQWQRTRISGPVAHYDVKCANADVIDIKLDLSKKPPSPPAGLRLLKMDGYVRYRAALEASDTKDSTALLTHLDAALEAAPEEPLYRVGRLSVLYATGRLFDALMEADALLKTHPVPIAWKFKALAARDLGLKREMFDSLDGLIASATQHASLFAEAVCARGLLRSDTGEQLAQAAVDLEAGCRLGQKDCCERLEEKRIADEAADAVIRSLRLQRDPIWRVEPEPASNE